MLSKLSSPTHFNKLGVQTSIHDVKLKFKTTYADFDIMLPFSVFIFNMFFPCIIVTNSHEVYIIP